MNHANTPNLERICYMKPFVETDSKAVVSRTQRFTVSNWPQDLKFVTVTDNLLQGELILPTFE